MKKYLIIFFCFGSSSLLSQTGISNTLDLLFVSSNKVNQIEIIDLSQNDSIAVIDTHKQVHELFATPFAPVLIFTSLEDNTANFIDLRNLSIASEMSLDVIPEFGVMDPSGTKIAFTNLSEGGIQYISAYGASTIFTIHDFPPTSAVLFDTNEIELFFSGYQNAWIGFLDLNTQVYSEIELPIISERALLSSPSRSLDGRYIYISNNLSGEVYAINAFSKIIFNSFQIGDMPARPYTTPSGSFMYMIDQVSGRFLSVDQNQFNVYFDGTLSSNLNLITVGRFDRFNLFMGTTTNNYLLFDNVTLNIVDAGNFAGIPIETFGSVDGRTAYIAFADTPNISVYSLENQSIGLIETTIKTGFDAMTVGLSNNVCH